MIQRCKNPKNKRYKDYGGRGISVVSDWLDFEVFYKDIGHKIKKGFSLERIDNNLSYSKENCTCILTSKQVRNQRRTVFNKEKVLLVRKLYSQGQSVKSISHDLSINLSTLENVIYRQNWTDI
jgi:hypothetical protein